MIGCGRQRPTAYNEDAATAEQFPQPRGCARIASSDVDWRQWFIRAAEDPHVDCTPDPQIRVATGMRFQRASGPARASAPIARLRAPKLDLLNQVSGSQDNME